MAKGRTKTGLVHKKGKEIFDISKQKSTGKYFIKGTDIEVSPDKLCRKGQVSHLPEMRHNRNNQKPWHSEELGDEWSDYAWSANDF